MNRIDETFKKLRQEKKKAFIPYITAGDPDLATSKKVIRSLSDAGADIIELGIPFSDPLADGPTIQNAVKRSLDAGCTVRKVFSMVKALRRSIDTPFVFMTYYNPVFNFGLEAFCQASLRAGIDGLIIPDLPPEEGAELEAITNKLKLDLIYLLAPTSTEERIATVTERSRGFIYLVSVTGVTGARQALPLELESFVKRIKQKATQPLCVGFGISTPEQARRVASVADGVIVGSHLIRLIEEDATFSSLKAFVLSLRKALDVKNKDKGVA